ncbi:MAG: FG-GAP-like repeat-containing protein [Candidatus Electryonea clarkiae]|nr:FG-GAP-like repeat-containing protein [Candidatus Electryonea clarkiae]MDP8285698.1 FG-GAP-like repeat-containing protein [Candidatus Electryonea clarkiae]
MKRNNVFVFYLFFFALFTFSVVPSYAQVEFTEHEIVHNYIDAISILGIDLDSDSDIDVLGSSANDIKWWENSGNQNFTQHSIEEDLMVLEVLSFDMDNDSDLDIIGASWGDGIFWWENDGNQEFEEHEISDDNLVRSIFVMDIDNDADLDFFCAKRTADGITWWENDGDQDFTEHDFGDDLRSVGKAFAIDLDNDDDVDIVGSSSSGLKWWENDGDLNFEAHAIYNMNPNRLFAADMDDDDDIDILYAYQSFNSGYGLLIFENDGDCVFSGDWISNRFAWGSDIIAADINSDGELDVVSVSGGNQDNVSWWENEGDLNFREYRIENDFNTGEDIDVIDMDGDYDIDILGAAGRPHHDMMWWENHELDDLSSVEGEVYDLETQDLIEGALISFRDFESMTDEDGFYSMNLTRWTYTVIVEADGYNPFEQSGVEIEDGENMFNFALIPSPSISINIDSLEFFCFEGRSDGSIFTISNDGLGTLHWQTEIIYEGQDSFWLWLHEDHGSVSSNDIFEVNVAAFAEDINQGNYYAMIYLMSDDLENDTIQIPVHFDVAVYTDVEHSFPNGLPRVFDIEEIYPNPFNPSTSVVVSLPESAFLNLSLYNISGQKVAVLANGQYSQGYKKFTVDGSMMASGIYFVHLEVPEKVSAIRKVVLMK